MSPWGLLSLVSFRSSYNPKQVPSRVPKVHLSTCYIRDIMEFFLDFSNVLWYNGTKG